MSIPSGLIASALIAVCSTGAPLLAQCGDYDGNGCDDLPAGSPQEGVDGVSDAGAINIIYGRPAGLKANGDQFLSFSTPGVAGDAAIDSYFGFSVASGDFNGDGFEDLATGAYYNPVDGILTAGTVSVFYGSDDGLRVQGDQLWHRNVPGVVGVVTQSMYFGMALAVGDFDGDGFDDLAIGAPDETVNALNDAGTVHILYGSGNGLTAAGDQLFSQNSDSIGDVAEETDYFGRSLASADFDGDGHDDLAIGIPLEDVDGVANCGAVSILYGTPVGLTATRDQFLHQGSSGIQRAPGDGDLFGWSLATGDFDDDGRADLAIGVRREVVNGVQTGAVAVLYGSSGGGLRANGDQLWHQDKPGIRDSAELDDRFASWLATGDFDDDGHDDLAIGIPFEDVAGVLNAGAVAILYGSSQGLRAQGDQFIAQSTPGVAGAASADNNFGAALYVGDFDGDGCDDLGVPALNETVGGIAGAGSVTVFYGSSGGGGGGGVSFQGEQRWTQDSAGIKDLPEPGDSFGSLGGYRF